MWIEAVWVSTHRLLAVLAGGFWVPIQAQLVKQLHWLLSSSGNEVDLQWVTELSHAGVYGVSSSTLQRRGL